MGNRDKPKKEKQKSKKDKSLKLTKQEQLFRKKYGRH